MRSRIYKTILLYIKKKYGTDAEKEEVRFKDRNGVFLFS